MIGAWQEWLLGQNATDAFERLVRTMLNARGVKKKQEEALGAARREIERLQNLVRDEDQQIQSVAKALQQMERASKKSKKGVGQVRRALSWTITSATYLIYLLIIQ